MKIHNNTTYKIHPLTGKSNKSTKLTVIAAAFTALSVTSTIAVATTSNTGIPKMTDLGTLGGGSNAVLVSADGSTVVGQSYTANNDYHAFKHTDASGMVDLGTLGGSYSLATSVSANGSVVVGQSYTANNDYHAFKHTDALGMVDLGTLGGSSSYATSVSANGSVVIGQSYIANNDYHAFKHTDALGMVDLGTLGGSNSSASAVSADGSVIVGVSDTSNNEHHAFKHTNVTGMVDLGTLGGTFSNASLVSANGAVVVGYSENASYESRLFKHTDATGMVDLGDLGGVGYSSPSSVSADGSVIVGQSHTASFEAHAFKHRDATGMVDLGTLGGTYSIASSVSANGSIVVGGSTTPSGNYRAFKHTDTTGMVDLGTLGGSNSSASAVSADGSVIVGTSDTVSGETHAFIYKTKMIDVVETQENLQKSAEQQTAALSFLQDKLTDALFQGCRPDSGNTCFSAGAKYYQQSNNEVDDTAAYVNIAHRFQPKVYAGIYLEQSVSSGFANTIDASNEQPLVAIYGGFSPSGKNLGLQIRVAAATHKINADITRPNLTNTEAGKGSTNFKGYSGQLEAVYALQATDKMIVSPVIGIRYSQVERGAYTESASVDFPYQYGKMESKQTNLFAGVQAEVNLSKQVSAYANVGLEQVLEHSEEVFSSKTAYLGGLKYSDPNTRETRGYASAGISYEVAPNQKIGLGVGYRQASFESSRDSLSANLGYTVQF